MSSHVTDEPVTVVRHGGEARAAVCGDFDMQATFTVEPELERLLHEDGLERIVLDLSGLSFIDSTGVGVVLRLNSESKREGIALQIIPGPMHVHRVFETSGLSDALPFAKQA
jgi:anti-anti-sigma factor